MTRRELQDRLEVQARRRAAQAMETHRPWLCDSEPGHEDHDGGPRMLAFAFLYCAVVLVLVGLGCWAWDREEALAQQADCVRLAMVQGAQVPTYCGEGK